MAPVPAMQVDSVSSGRYEGGVENTSTPAPFSKAAGAHRNAFKLDENKLSYQQQQQHSSYPIVGSAMSYSSQTGYLATADASCSRVNLWTRGKDSSWTCEWNFESAHEPNSMHTLLWIEWPGSPMTLLTAGSDGLASVHCIRTGYVVHFRDALGALHCATAVSKNGCFVTLGEEQIARIYMPDVDANYTLVAAIDVIGTCALAFRPDACALLAGRCVLTRDDNTAGNENGSAMWSLGCELQWEGEDVCMPGVADWAQSGVLATAHGPRIALWEVSSKCNESRLVAWLHDDEQQGDEKHDDIVALQWDHAGRTLAAVHANSAVVRTWARTPPRGIHSEWTWRVRKRVRVQQPHHEPDMQVVEDVIVLSP